MPSIPVRDVDDRHRPDRSIPDAVEAVARRSWRAVSREVSEERDMLSERDAQALRSIEERLTADDPTFVARMSRPRSAASSRALGVAQVLIIAVGLVLATMLVVLAEPGPSLVAVVFACILYGLRRVWLSQRRTQG
jgi:Flp pilus assembly protein TadB